MGPNGAGKTTIIRCMMDFIRPTSGSIRILGLDSSRDSVTLKLKIGYLAPEPRLYDNLTGQDHISLIEKIRGKGEKTKELIKRLNANINVPIKTLSTGNKQKISLVLALMNNPEVVIMDEPTTGLDPLLQNTIYEILLEMRNDGKTIIMSSHNLSEVEKVCQRAAIIRNGALVAIEDINKLNEKRLYKIRLVYVDEKDIIDIDKLDSVTIIAKTSSEIHLSVTGSVERIVKYLSDKNIPDIEIEHAGLEEVFMNFYKGGNK